MSYSNDNLPNNKMASLAMIFSSNTDVPPRLLIIHATLSPVVTKYEIAQWWKWNKRSNCENKKIKDILIVIQTWNCIDD